MDLMAHALYGVTVCSRTGLAGGHKGAGCRWFRDRTVWVAAFFGVLPDIVSMGVPFAAWCLAGAPGNFFRDIHPEDLEIYRYVHSLAVALVTSGILWTACRPLFAPSLAWSVHVVSDALTHASGKFQTPLLYPFSSWGIEGVRWWRHPEVVLAYWLLIPITWYTLHTWRRRVSASHR